MEWVSSPARSTPEIFDSGEDSAMSYSVFHVRTSRGIIMRCYPAKGCTGRPGVDGKRQEFVVDALRGFTPNGFRRSPPTERSLSPPSERLKC